MYIMVRIRYNSPAITLPRRLDTLINKHDGSKTIVLHVSAYCKMILTPNLFEFI